MSYVFHHTRLPTKYHCSGGMPDVQYEDKEYAINIVNHLTSNHSAMGVN